MLEGETIGSGAPSTCPDCGRELVLSVLRSAAGYYLGTECDCGPYSRESGYYQTREQADRALALEGGNYVPRVGDLASEASMYLYVRESLGVEDIDFIHDFESMPERPDNE